ncbi:MULTISPECIES: hypothetical protein [unclassified Fibrobacter]|uniref:hypothetical protein n=1 Tax=unclassified Fibrobacter TaxID=2634177 RepID=UPI000911BBD5|nr:MULTISPECIES: hypothetical protein [unclassified Fibrobacter]OWV07151.1 hypothetical protein B7992_14530 [Fibrobacter sp. UWH1]SHK46088.1 hypothetical protein SAMN05720764_101480 [Fibrobacter sp. UWH5]
MLVVSRILILFGFLAVCAGAATVQVIEGDADGTWDLSAKKLRAMATVYLAELGHAPSPEIENVGVSFTASGPAKRSVRMKKFSFNGQIEEDSVTVADADSVDVAVENMLTKSFGTASKRYKSDRPAEVFFMDPEFIGVDDNTADLAAKNTETALEELGYGLSDDHDGVKLQMTFVKLKNTYWLGMVRFEGSKIIRAAHKKFLPGDDLEMVAYSLTDKIMNSSTKLDTPYTEVVDYENTHEARCRATDGVSSATGAVAGLAADVLCNMSDYMGLEVAAGGKDLYGDWYSEVRFDLAWGFSDSHSWLLGLDYAGTMGYTKSRWAIESIHRFSQTKGLFFDILWGWGCDDWRRGWYMGADIGYNLLMFGPKAHWLSLMLRYDWNIDDSVTDDGRISVNLVYNLRGYYTD